MYAPVGSAGPAAADQAITAVLDGLGSLALLPAAELPASEQADLLRKLEQAESMLVAARSAVLHAFSTSGGHQDDGQHSARSWLVWQTRVTRGAAAGASGWVRRLAAHPAVDQALAAGAISTSWAKRVCELSDRLPEDRRDDADAILLAAAAAPEVTLADVHGLAEEMFRRCAPPDGDGRGEPGARGVFLDTHFRGAGKLSGDLTPQCAEALGAVLESLGRRQGPEDDRTRPERFHDALEEACRRLVAAGGLPDRAGQPVRVQLHMTLSELMRLQASAPAGGVPGAPAGHGPGGHFPGGRAGHGPVGRDASARGGPVNGPDGPGADSARRDGATWGSREQQACGEPDLSELGWLAGAAARPGDLCDATVVPVVTGRVDPVLLDELAARLLRRPGGGCACPAGRLSPSGPPGARGAPPGAAAGIGPRGGAPPGIPAPDKTAAGAPPGTVTPSLPPSAVGPPPPRGGPPAPDPLDAARDLLLTEAVRLLSGPGGLAAAARTGLPVPLAATASLPLDTGRATDTIPAHLRRAVIARDRACRFPGCAQPPAACEIHHITWRARGGRTALANLALICRYHHQHAIHEHGWHITLRPDATLTARSPDGTRTLHSHPPPLTAAA